MNIGDWIGKARNEARDEQIAAMQPGRAMGIAAGAAGLYPPPAAGSVILGTGEANIRKTPMVNIRIEALANGYVVHTPQGTFIAATIEDILPRVTSAVGALQLDADR